MHLKSDLETLYRRYSRAAHGLAYRLLGDRELAADAVQQAFLQIWRAADGYDPSRPVEPWLFAIVRRAAIDTYRRQREHAGHAQLEATGVEPPTPEGNGGESGIERAWHAREVRRALRLLPSTDRDIIALTYFADLSQRDVAEALDLPVGTVKSRLFRAQRRLAGLLSHIAWPGSPTAQESSHAC